MDRPLELTRKAAEFLAGKGFENARLEAELLLAGVLGIGRLDLYLQHERPLGAEEVEAFREAVRRRLRHEPLQYIRGKAAFRELELVVDRRVLIPRPETEVLVGEVLAWAAARPEPGTLTALDIGTGSGAIALSLAREGEFARVVASDVSRDALDVARENARRAGLQDRVELREADLWRAVGADERFDVIVANPPYIADSERAGLQPEVRDWEPAAALYAPGGGLAIVEALVAGAPSRLRSGGLLALEIGSAQGEAVAALVARSGAYLEARLRPDLTGRERVVLAELRPDENRE